MVVLLPSVMPEQMQHSVLEVFDDCHAQNQEPPALTVAWDWFKLRVQEDLENECLQHLRTYFKFETEEVSDDQNNDDIHIDVGLSYLTRYVMTLCTVPEASTIYFPPLSKDIITSRPTSYEWFSRDAISHQLHAIRRCNEPLLDYTQAKNGQVSRFAVNTDYHSAAPLPHGTKKIFFRCQTFLD
jgi:hypothetical protein